MSEWKPPPSIDIYEFMLATIKGAGKFKINAQIRDIVRDIKQYSHLQDHDYEAKSFYDDLVSTCYLRYVECGWIKKWDSSLSSWETYLTQKIFSALRDIKKARLREYFKDKAYHVNDDEKWMPKHEQTINKKDYLVDRESYKQWNETPEACALADRLYNICVDILGEELTNKLYKGVKHIDLAKEKGMDRREFSRWLAAKRKKIEKIYYGLSDT